MKGFMLLFFLLFCDSIGYSQKTLIGNYKRYIQENNKVAGKYKRGYWRNLQKVSNMIYEKYNININRQDTVYMVFSWPDNLIGGFTAVRIWNSKFDFSYNEGVLRQVLKPDLEQIEYAVLQEVEPIKHLIEKLDKLAIYDGYVKNCNYFDGSIYIIFWFIKKKKNVISDGLSGRLCTIDYFEKLRR